MNYFSIMTRGREFLIQWKGYRVIVYLLMTDVEPTEGDIKDLIGKVDGYLEINDSIYGITIDEDKARELATDVIDSFEEELLGKEV